MKPKYKRLVDELLQDSKIKELMTSKRAETDNENWGSEVHGILEGLFIEYTMDIPEQLIETLQEEYETRISDYFWEAVGNLQTNANQQTKEEKK